jgi:elongation factor 1-gamma
LLTPQTFDAAYKALLNRLAQVDKIFLHQTYCVGERITLADIFLVTALNNAFSGKVDKAARDNLPNLVRFVTTINNHPKLAHIFDNGNPEWTDVQSKPPVPVKEKAKEPKPAAPAAAAAPKAEKKPKKKEEDEEEDDGNLVPEEPKEKNPLDDLPKSAFNLEEWKRQYSNLDTRKEALPWFYEKFDAQGFSIWRVDFKYNEELTLTFMSSNQIGGFFNRLEGSRKYLFGSMGVLGKSNDSVITGVIVCRGDDFKPVMNVAPDWESYAYKAIDLSNTADKEFFEGAMAWDLVVDGKEWADGKNFK